MLKLLHKILFVGALTLLQAGPVQAAPLVHLEAAPTSPAVGSSFKIDVIGKDFLDLYAFNFTLSYDPTLIRAVSVNEGSLLPSAGSTFFIPGFIDNMAGSVVFTGDSLLGAIVGAGGSGSLATLRFEALAEGVSNLSLSDLLFLDSSFSDIAIATEDLRVVIRGSTEHSVPEPMSAGLLLAGLGAYLVLMERRSTWMAGEKMQRHAVSRRPSRSLFGW